MKTFIIERSHAYTVEANSEEQALSLFHNNPDNVIDMGEGQVISCYEEEEAYGNLTLMSDEEIQQTIEDEN